jgi:hypothetical protein
MTFIYDGLNIAASHEGEMTSNNLSVGLSPYGVKETAG